MQHLSISVPTPCHEKWNTFTPTEKGAHCKSCQKEVIDFSSWSEERLISYFQKEKVTCGRFRKDQLKVYSISQEKLPSRNYLAFVLATSSALFVPVTSSAQEPVAKEQSDPKSLTTEPPARLNSTIKLSGTIIDRGDSSKLPGVNVVLKGTSLGTVSDADGRYTLTIKNPTQNEYLVISFIGMETKEIDVSSHTQRTIFDVALEPDAASLNEFIVVGGICSVRRYSPRNIWWRIKGLFRSN